MELTRDDVSYDKWYAWQIHGFHSQRESLTDFLLRVYPEYAQARLRAKERRQDAAQQAAQRGTELTREDVSIRLWERFLRESYVDQNETLTQWLIRTHPEWTARKLQNKEYASRVVLHRQDVSVPVWRAFEQGRHPGESLTSYLHRVYPGYAAQVCSKKANQMTDKEKEMDKAINSGVTQRATSHWEKGFKSRRQAHEELIEDYSEQILSFKSFGLDNYADGDVIRVVKVWDEVATPVAPEHPYDKYYSPKKDPAEVVDNRTQYVYTLLRFDGGKWAVSSRLGHEVYHHWGHLVEEFLVDGDVINFALATEWSQIQRITDGRKLRNM